LSLLFDSGNGFWGLFFLIQGLCTRSIEGSYNIKESPRFYEKGVIVATMALLILQDRLKKPPCTRGSPDCICISDELYIKYGTHRSKSQRKDVTAETTMIDINHSPYDYGSSVGSRNEMERREQTISA